MMANLRKIPIEQWLVLIGLVLVWFALLYLWQRWRGRKKETAVSPPPSTPFRRLWHTTRYILRLALFALAAFTFIGLGVMVYIDYQAVIHDTSPTPSQVEIPADLPFPVKDAYFSGEEGPILSGWYVPSQNGAAVILLHGYGSNRLSMRWHAEQLYAAGYGILMYDERASGESGGDHRSYGWEDAADVGGALSYLQRQFDVFPDRIGIAGCSIGGQIALQGAAYYPQIRAVWADGPSSITSADIPQPDNWATGLAYISNHILDKMYAQRLGIEAPPPMITIIGTIAPRPIMMVAGGIPHPYFGSEEQYVAYMAQFAGANSEIWLIPEAYHCDGPTQRPDEYATRMITFFDETLLP
ncbi:MAG: alpha/beta fold hydrolase [Ardenticatenaceae bacterium]|nr:alpha/beta fold hydrolase [Ardenticatenaceae bacterium]